MASQTNERRGVSVSLQRWDWTTGTGASQAWSPACTSALQDARAASWNRHPRPRGGAAEAADGGCLGMLRRCPLGQMVHTGSRKYQTQGRPLAPVWCPVFSSTARGWVGRLLQARVGRYPTCGYRVPCRESRCHPKQGCKVTPGAYRNTKGSVATKAHFHHWSGI
jgi:hypothetical protein